MKYKGEVTLTFGTRYGALYTYVNHNGGEKDLQLAFANMLSGYNTKQFIPRYIGGNFGLADITGLNKRPPADIGGEQDVIYVECEAIVPIDQSVQTMLASDYQYKLYGQSTDILLASFYPDIDSADITAITNNIGSTDGLQLNIKWKMYLSLEG